MISQWAKYGWVILTVLLFQSCYSFKGISIPAGVDTFYVENFNILAQNAPAESALLFSESLREKIRSNSKLIYSEIDPQLEFSGSLTRFDIVAVAPQAGNTAAFNRLTIGLKVEYVNNENEEDNWTNNFSFYQDVLTQEDIGSQQDELMEIIFEQLTEDIFNKAFTNW